MDKKMEKAMRRHYIAIENNMFWWDVVLDDDLKESAFDSQTQWESFTTLLNEDRKRAVHGVQFINGLDGHTPILVGTFAKSMYVDKPPQLTLPIEFAACFKYAELRSIAKRQYAVTSESDEYFEIDSLGILVFNAESATAIYTNAKYCHVCGGKILIADESKVETNIILNDPKQQIQISEGQS